MADAEFKRCTKCGLSKPVLQFPLCRGVPRARCKPCHTVDATDWAARNQERAKASRSQWRIANKQPKFYGPPVPEAIRLERRRASRLRWAQSNPELDKSTKQRWAEANKHVCMEVVRRRQANKLRATPRWADKSAMQAFYRLARSLTEATGVPHEVDHIVTLQGKNVCGLHCEANLQVIPRRDNRAKANKLLEVVE